MKFSNIAVMACVALGCALPGFAISTVTVMTVPFNPLNFAQPHTVITGVTATLGATVNLGSSGDTFTFSWNFGDGSPATSPIGITTGGTSASVGNVYNLSATHIYTIPSVLGNGQPYTAVITVTDTNNSATYTANYPVVVEWNAAVGSYTAANLLAAEVNVAIDNGLWYLHTDMDRTTETNANSVVVPVGGWDGQLGNGCVNGSYACENVGGLDATNVQAYEVSGHLANGPALDPYTEDVQRGLARVFNYMVPQSITTKSIGYNPALMAARCSDGSQPNYSAQTCSSGTYINYNPTATSCPSGSCNFTYDGNNNNQMIIEGNDGNYPGYQTGMLVTALVSANNPSAVATTGAAASGGLPGVLGQTYQNIIQDLVDSISFCQYYGDAQNASGYDNGGGWEYYCAGTTSQNFDDNSPSQWNAIAEIAASRGASITIPSIVTDANQIWTLWSECMGTTCTGSGQPLGEFGYYEWGYEPWGPYAVTPSGMVQLAMDGVGRSDSGHNKVANDSRWDLAESFYHDNFCNGGGSTNAPKLYTYGMFSFTKAMEQHDPGGILTPITLLYDEPNETGAAIDWYGAVSGVGPNAPCDGVANTLVNRQLSNGAWYGVDYSSDQFPFETAWSVIMLQKTAFAAAACPAALAGQGKAGGRSGGASITVTWATYTGATSYTILRASANTGPFNSVGTTTGLAFNDQTKGLVNGNTYWYEIQPDNSNGIAVCTTTTPISVTVP